MTDKELINLVASFATDYKEATREASKEVSKEMKELRKFQKESNKQANERSKEADERSKQADERIKQTDEQMKQTDIKLKSIGIQLGNISSNQGDVAEEFFVNSLSIDLKVAGIQYDELSKNMHKRTKKVQGEFDIVLINGQDIAIIETKYKAHSNDLDDLLNRQYNNFKKLYPQYKDYNHHLGLASFYINEDLKRKALDSSVFVLQRKGDIIESFLPSK